MPTACTCARPASGSSTRARRSRRRRCGRATACSSPGRSARTAWRSCSPAASSSCEAPIVSDTASLWPAADALLEAAGADVHCMRDATRGGVASALNELARASEVGGAPARGRRTRRAGGRRPPRSCSGSIRCTSPTRAGWLRSSRPGRPTPRSRRCARSPGCEQAAEIGEVAATSPPGMVLVDTAFGGRRVMDLLAGDPLPRIC